MKKKINGFTIFLVYLQIALAIISTVVFILYLFNNEMVILLQLCFGITLLLMSFLSKRIYEKNKFTVISFIFGLMLLICCILKMVGVL